MPQQLKPFSKSNPCPICGGGISCRQGTDDPDFILCHKEADAKFKQIIRGQDGNLYTCVSEAINGHTASFKPAQSNAECQEEHQPKASASVKSSKVALPDLLQLSDIELDSLYRRILEELPLDADYEASLLSRGYTEQQIKDAGFKTLPKWFNPSFPLPENFPGQIWVRDREDRLLGRQKIFGVVPIINDGLICALTLENRNRGDDEGKYLRHSNPDFPFHRDGEQPIQVYLPDDGEHKRVWLGIEGGAHKPILFNLKSGEPVIAGMACNLSSSPNLLASAIAKAKAKYGDDVEFIGIVPDAGAVLNPAVIKAYDRNIKAFKDLGIETKSAWWGQVTKDDDDIDELPDFSSIQFVSNKEFFDIVKREKVNTEVEGFKPKISIGSYKTKIRKTPDWQNWIDKNKYTPDVILKGDGDLVLPKNINIEGKNVFIKSGLGTNKTGSSLVLLNEIEKEKGIYTILLSYINSLLHQTGDRAKQIGKDFTHIQTDDDGKLLSKDSRSNVSLCVHSLGYVDGHFSDRDVFVDEIESVVQTLVSGANLGKWHGDYIQMFFRGLRNSWGNLFTDGNATDLLVKLIENLTGRPAVKYEYQQSQKRVKTFNFIVTPTKKGQPAINDPSAIIEKCLADIRASKKIFLSTDSRAFGEGIAELAKQSDERSIEETMIDTLVCDAEKGGYKVFILSKKTSGTEEGKKFLANPGQYILDNKIDFFIGTPSIGSGVSVQMDDYFDAQYTVFCGVLSTKQQKQLLARYRNNKLIHHVYCPIKSLIKDRSRPQEYSAIEFISSLNAMQQTGRSITMDEIQGLWELARSRVNPIFEKYSAEMGALDNFEQDNLLECLTYELEAEGHIVTLTFGRGSKAASDEMKAAKAAIRVRESEEFFKIEPFSSVDEAEGVTRNNPTPENHLRKDKTYFLEKLPGISDKPEWSPEFINEFIITDSQQKVIKGVTREFMLRNFDIAQERHNLRMLNNAQKDHPVGKDLMPGDFSILWALKELKFGERVLDVEQFTCKSPDIQEMVAEYKARKDLQRSLRIEVAGEKVKDTTINDFIKPLLGLLAMQAEEAGKTKIEGMQYSAYKAVTVFEEEKVKTAIYDCLQEKWVKWKEKKELESKLASATTQDDLATQAIKLIAEVRRAEDEGIRDTATINVPEDIQYLSELLIDVDRDMYSELEGLYPLVAIKGAMLTLPQSQIDQLTALGAPQIDWSMLADPLTNSPIFEPPAKPTTVSALTPATAIATATATGVEQQFKAGDEVIVISDRLPVAAGTKAKILMILPSGGFKCEYKIGSKAGRFFPVADDLKLVAYST